MQALLTALMWGLGLGIGTLIAGVVYDAFGPLVLYRAGVRFLARRSL